ncbi:MAG: cell wall hydrolase [Ruminococcaceae bacterium]|nr:cell wall hydrolase [Oscillospiraceae bacterium]
MYNYIILLMVVVLKRILLIVLSLIICITSCFFFLSESSKLSSNNECYISKNTVVIDAGHGGIDAGTSGVDGSKEKDINLCIAKSLYDFLMVCGINSVLIRNNDTEFYKQGEERIKSDLYNRLDFVNSVENAVLISIHQNHFENESEWGTQIWYSANTKESKELADSVLSTVKEFIQPENSRENKESDSSYYILYKASVPSIMIECGFMSNYEENKKLQSTNYQNDFAFCILSGICNQI